MTTIKKVMIESDAWSRLRTIRSGVVYDNILTFLYELIQNSQRAKATKVYILTGGNTFQIIDNGIGCKDPKVLFTMDFSGFGVGYGIGFTSIYPIADRVKVETLNWKANIDVEKAIKEKDLGLDIEENDFFQGFKLTLESEKVGQYQYDIEDKVKEIASIIPDIQFYLNGLEIKKINLFENVNYSPYYKKVKNRIYEGGLSINRLSDFGGVEVYYDYRHVCRFHIDGVSGNILITEDKTPKKVYDPSDPDADERGYVRKIVPKINLKAPDRKSIIWDDKRRELKEQIENDIRELCKMVIKSEKEEDIEEYAETIDYYLGVENYIRYLTIDEDEIKNQYETREVAQKETESGQLELDLEQNEREDTHSDEVENDVYPEEIADRERRKVDQVFSSYVSGGVRSGFVSKNNLNQVSISNIKRKKNVVWVERKEVERYEELITKYEYYGIYTFISPHVLYDKALRHLEIKHISDVEDTAIEKQYKVTKTGAKNKKEQRAMELLNFIERKLGLEETFYISDIECKMVVSLQKSKIYQEKLHVMGYAQGDKIHLDRKSLKFGKLSGSSLDREKIGLHDVLFILANIELIAHELSHVLYSTKDNTISHYEGQNRLQEKIGQFFLENDTLR